MFNNPQIRALATSSNEDGLRLSERDWPLVLNANRAFEEKTANWKGDHVWGDYLLNKISGIGPLDLSSSLELCCGNGFLFFSFRDRANLEMGCHFIDLSEVQLQAFVQRCQQSSIPAPSVLRGDIGKLPFANCSKRLIYGHSFLHHLPDVGGYVREIARVLEKDGYFIDFHEPTPTAPLLESFPRPLLKRVKTDSLTDIWLIKPDVIVRLLRGAGFSKADVYPSNLLASFLVVPWQTVLAKLRKPYQGSALLTLRMWCDKLDRLLPGGVRRRYAPSIAIVAQK